VPSPEDLAAEVAALRARVETVEQLAGRLDRAESVLAINELKARYAELVDARFVRGRPAEPEVVASRAAAAAALFTEDGTWDGGPTLGVAQGRTAIAERLAAPTLVFSRHLFLAPRIAVDGDRATGRWDLLSPCTRPDGTHQWVCGWEDDTYRRIDGQWLHEHMRLTTVFVAPVGEGWPRILA
jgi:hypothetical protein